MVSNKKIKCNMSKQGNLEGKLKNPKKLQVVKQFNINFIYNVFIEG